MQLLWRIQPVCGAIPVIRPRPAARLAGTWAMAGLVPGAICLLLTPALLYVLYPPEVKDTPDAPAKARPASRATVHVMAVWQGRRAAQDRGCGHLGGHGTQAALDYSFLRRHARSWPSWGP